MIELYRRHPLTQTHLAFAYMQQIFRLEGLIIRCNLNLVVRDHFEPYNWKQKDIGIECNQALHSRRTALTTEQTPSQDGVPRLGVPLFETPLRDLGAMLKLTDPHHYK